MVENGIAEESRSKKKGAVIAIVALALVVAMAVFAYAALPGIRAGMPYKLATADEVDKMESSSLMACTIEDFDGNAFTLGDLSSKSGKPLVVNLWATWCPHCVTEMGDFQKLYDGYGDQVEFVMLNLKDTPGEKEAARAYIDENGFTFPVYLDASFEVREALAITGVPSTAIVSTDGDLLLVRSGTINYNAMKGTIDNLLSA